MGLPERILHTLADPNVAYLLVTIGVIGLLAEFYNLGSFFPGIIGIVSLLLAFVAFEALPVNWAGVLLLILAIGLFVAALYAERPGLPAAGSLVAFVLGSLTLFRTSVTTSTGTADVSVSPWLVGGMTVSLGVCFLLMRAVVESTRAPAATGAQSVVGRVGVAVSDLAPAGMARVEGELWSAVAEDGPIRAGEEVRVAGVEGVRLKVTRP
jgi:membrane-bound serine protease (ClpP class)